ncbi:hypothetical protein [Persicirhabdus sediminis]|uniref:Uncharacterized protein n=1 Tax=Persicirhabdus sediminis TaxID=454144 RepID=A0A8J7MCN5_9BACT|nr:hypothetical protein [Persicirhabdus sediminis]MBK1790040.1 hypothetical protein [Persicirhabdus sediminis]
MRISILILLSLALLVTTKAGTRVLTFVHQPLTTLGTEMDAGIVIARVPVLTNAVPEGLLSHVATRNRLLQDESASISDSNILSLLGITLSVKLEKGARYSVTMDLSGAGDPSKLGVSLEAVVAATVECINKTILETNVFHVGSGNVVWSLKLKGSPEQSLVLAKYQRDYDPRKSQRAE